MAAEPAIGGREQPDDRVEIKTLRSVDDLDGIRDWWASCPAHRDARIDFYLLILGSLPEVLHPYILAAYREGKLVALLLGRLESKPIVAKIGYLRFPTPGLRIINFLYAGRLGEASAEIDRAFADAIIAALRSDDAQAAMLHCLRIDSPLYDYAKRLPSFLLREHCPSVVVHRARNLPTGSGAFVASLSAKERSNQKRRTKRLEKDFGDRVRIDCLRTEGEVDRLASDAEIVARASYQRALGVGFRDTPETRHRLSLEAARGSLRGFILYLDDRPCSFWILSFCENVLYSDFLGYDSAYGHYTPGIYLVHKVLAQFCDTEPPGLVYRLDFGMGEMEWKTLLGDQVWQEGNIYIFSPKIRPILANGIYTMATLTNRVARGLLATANLDSYVKKAWRRRLAKM